MTQAILLNLLVAIVAGTAGAAIGLWIEHWMRRPRRHIVGQYECPHGFATVAACPTCAHFAETRAAFQEESGR
jgi:hypothetical protein